MFNGQRLDAPFGNAQLQAVILARPTRYRIAYRPFLEKRGRFPEVGEDRAGRQRLRYSASNGDVHAVVVTAQCDSEAVAGFRDSKHASPMHSRKNPSADEHIHARIGITTWDVDAFVGAAVRVPFYRNAMGGVLRAKSQSSGKIARPNVRKANQTDAGDGVSVDEFRPKGRRQNTI